MPSACQSCRRIVDSILHDMRMFGKPGRGLHAQQYRLRNQAPAHAQAQHWVTCQPGFLDGLQWHAEWKVSSGQIMAEAESPGENRQAFAQNAWPLVEAGARGGREVENCESR